ncbi:flagellar basal-body MS-ring/collar protein FliF [Carnobacteriaceae bacterium 52-44]
MDKLKSIASDIKAGWENMDKKKRVRLVSIVVTISVVLFLLVYATQRTEYKVLFSELEEADSGAIVEDLESKGMDYKLEDNGTTILIDKDLVDNYRIELAVNGPMPSTSTGFEIFDSSSMMATDEDRAIMYQRAISGELERAISSLANVESGKVLLNIPESSVFQNPDYQKEATASVVLQMNNNQMPDQATVQGIAALVSGAVENLPQANVEILDTSGRLLSASISDGYNLSSDVVTEHQRIKNMVENDLEQNVRTLLSPVYGLENVQISVNADLNFDAIEREQVEYGEQSIRSQTESVTGNAALAQEVQSGNLEDGTVNVIDENADEDNSSYEHATNFELDTTTSRIVEAPGAIERITASVIILDNPTDRAAIQGLVENALGINDFKPEGEPIDSVQIEYVMPPTEDEAPTLIGNPEFFETIISWITENWLLLVISVVVLTVILILFRVLRNRFADEEDDELEMEFAEILPPAPEPEETLFDKETEEKMRRNQVANEKEDMIREQTKENPELAAELIKIWLKEEDK